MTIEVTIYLEPHAGSADDIGQLATSALAKGGSIRVRNRRVDVSDQVPAVVTGDIVGSSTAPLDAPPVSASAKSRRG